MPYPILSLSLAPPPPPPRPPRADDDAWLRGEAQFAECCKRIVYPPAADGWGRGEAPDVDDDDDADAAASPSRSGSGRVTDENSASQGFADGSEGRDLLMVE